MDRIENALRALEVYEEELDVRTRKAAPLAYAQTIVDRARALADLPDDLGAPHAGKHVNLRRAYDDYAEACAILLAHGENERAHQVAAAAAEIASELDSVGFTSHLFGSRT
jgi:hypothetical protein